MKNLFRNLVVVCIVLLSFISMVSASYATYPSKTDIITEFKNLVNAHPNLASTEIIGKSHLGKNIYIFIFGNITGGRVLWDSELHGNEIAGAIIAYWFAEWLLTSTTLEAKNILRYNCFMVIPVANPDGYGRTNDNHYGGTVKYGVDLNRNFVTGWANALTNNKQSLHYKGPYPASEKETQALRYAFQRFRPTFYVNTHMWGGPFLGYYHSDSYAILKSVVSCISKLKATWGGTPYTLLSLRGNGYAVADAWTFGSQSFLLEIDGTTTPSISTLKSYYYPNCRLILLAMFHISAK